MLFKMEDCLSWLMEQENVYDLIVGKLVSINECEVNPGIYFDDSDNFDGIVAIFAFRIPAFEFIDGRNDAYVYINGVIIKLLNLDVDKIRPAAIRNMRWKVFVTKMNDILGEYIHDLPSVPLAVLTTHYMANGAFYLCDLGALHRVCDEVCNPNMQKVIFMPSSAHELLIVLDPEITPEMAKSLVYECNREPDVVNDALTDRIYIYDRYLGILTEI